MRTIGRMTLCGLLLAAAPAVAEAAERTPQDADQRPIRRFRPERNMVELGVFGGAFIFSKAHDFYDPATAPQEPLRRVSPDLGVRAAFFPARFLGFEAEFSALPGSKYLATASGPGGSAFLYGARAHAILQLPMFRVVPFLLGGYGLMGVTSAATVAGKDVDPIGHYGVGVKYFINKYVGLRLDVRHFVGAQAAREVDGTSHAQVLLGLVITLNRAKPAAEKPAPVDPDRDKDGFPNDADKCPDEPGVEPDGCPAKDSDDDGFLDSVDKCPEVPGVAPDGCPPKDRDRDGFLDEVDKCPEEPGVEPDGCPIRDSDGDQILDPDDQCPDEPETRNGYQDTDGCPDEVPQQVVKFTGVIRGIYFQTGSDQIQKKSEPTLSEAAKILTDFPDVKIEISGHTDNIGDRDYNLDLSRRRAESVKAYFISRGIAGERIRTRGAGPDEPIADNKKASGRAKNRRIEFKLIDE
jgi:outer membrane protein OmpA-like peptidoglycan-associated protein